MNDESWAIIGEQHRRALSATWRLSNAIALRDPEAVLRAVAELREMLQPIGLAAEELRDARSQQR